MDTQPNTDLIPCHKALKKIKRAHRNLDKADAALAAGREKTNEALAQISEMFRDDLSRHEIKKTLDEIGRCADIVGGLALTIMRLQTVKHRAIEFEEARAQDRKDGPLPGLPPEALARIERRLGLF